MNRSFLAAFAACLALSAPAVAQTTYTWNNGSANGNWDTTSLNWTAGGPNTPWVNATNNTARFINTGAGNVSLTNNITTGTVQVLFSGYTFNSAGSSLTLSTYDIGNGISATVNAPTTGGGVTKTGNGTIVLGNAFNGYTSIAINSGTLRVGAAGALASAGAVTLASGTLSTGSGISTTAGALTVTSSSAVIDLGSAAHVLRFASLDASGGFAGMTVNNWAGSPGSAGTQGQIFFTNPSSFNASILSQITFNLAGGGTIFGGQILGSNELVPVPEPTAVLGIAVAGFGLARFRRIRRTGMVAV